MDQEGTSGSSCSSSDISVMGPGVYGTAVPTDLGASAKTSAYMERMTTDLSALKKQYKKLRQRQAQAHIILTGNNFIKYFTTLQTVTCKFVLAFTSASFS